jgi:hypothetical protein
VNVQRVSVVILVLFAIAFIACSGVDVARRDSEQSSPSSAAQPSIAIDAWRFLPAFAKVSVATTYAIPPFGSVSIAVPQSTQQYRLVRFLPMTGTPMTVVHIDMTKPPAMKGDQLLPGKRETLLLPPQASAIQLICQSTATCVVSTQ